MKIKPLGDRVLIEPMTQEDVKRIGKINLMMPQTADKERPEQGKIVAVGAGKIGKDGKIIPMNVKKGDTVKITFKNTGGMHDLKIDGYTVGTKIIQGGAQETFQFVADKAGTFEYYCSVGTHRQMGMKGTLTVTE